MTTLGSDNGKELFDRLQEEVKCFNESHGTAKLQWFVSAIAVVKTTVMMNYQNPKRSRAVPPLP